MKEYEHDERVMSSILDDKAKVLGDKVFVRYREERLTYAELSEGSNRIANFLIQELGVAKQDKIAVMLPNCIDFFYAQFGICKAGAVMVPINVLAKLDLLIHFITNSDARIVIIDEQFLPLLESIAKKIPNVKTLIVRTPELKPKKFAFMRKLNIIPFRELFNAPPIQPKPLANWYDPVDIFYTSGTTGVSKGVVLPQNHHYTFGRAIAQVREVRPQRQHVRLPSPVPRDGFLHVHHADASLRRFHRAGRSVQCQQVVERYQGIRRHGYVGGLQHGPDSDEAAGKAG